MSAGFAHPPPTTMADDGRPEEQAPGAAPPTRADIAAALARAAAAVEQARALTRNHPAPGAPGDVPTLAQRLRASEARFHTLVEVAGHASWTLDPAGRALRPQPGWQAYTGQSFREMREGAGLGWAEAVHPDDRGALLAAFDAPPPCGGVPREHRVRVRRTSAHGGPEWRHTLVRMAPVLGPAADDGPRPVCEWVGTATDVTELVAAETAAAQARAELERARDAAVAARAEAESATAAKGRVLAAASHDLRTPLAAIAGYAELLASEVYGPVTPSQRDVLQRIGVAKERLLALVGDILEAARAEAGRDVRLHAAAVDVADVCADLDTLLAPQAAAKGIDLSVARCEVPSQESERVALRGDPARVLQILVNLAANAIAHTPAGGQIGVRVAADGAWVRIGVWDSGEGIPPELHETIFQPFVQVGGAGLGGIGLGLATSRSLARRMGGDVTVESAPGAGSTFTLRMPRVTD